MKLYAQHGSSNMGDFLNCLPVLSGIYKQYGKIDLVIQDSMEKFNGFIDLLSYQDIFNTVTFQKETPELSDYIWFNSWVNGVEYDGINPIETTRYEKYIKHVSGIQFNIDSEFELKIPHLNIGKFDTVIGDRCSKTTVDTSRPSEVLKNSGKFNDSFYLDFSRSCIYNANVIKQSNKFITMFTGISILADLMNVPLEVYYTKELDGWQNQPIQYSYMKHFYANRKSTLKLLDE
jgi:hypothetical protein